MRFTSQTAKITMLIPKGIESKERTMKIGTSNGKDVMYWHNMIWIRGGYTVIRNAGVLREAIERARRCIHDFVAIDD